MEGDVVNFKLCSPLKPRSGLSGNYHAICHCSYNLPLCVSVKNNTADNLLLKDRKRKRKNEQPTHKTAHLLLPRHAKPNLRQNQKSLFFNLINNHLE